MEKHTSIRLCNRSTDCVADLTAQLTAHDYPVELVQVRGILAQAMDILLKESDMDALCYYELENSKGHWIETVALRERSSQNYLIHIGMNNAKMELPTTKVSPSVNLRRAASKINDHLSGEEYCHPAYVGIVEHVISLIMRVIKDTHQFTITTDEMGMLSFHAIPYSGVGGVAVYTRSMGNVVAKDLEIEQHITSMGYKAIKSYQPTTH